MADNNQYTITIKVESGVIGHAFLTLQGPGQSPITVGYYPVVHSPSAPGIVIDDSLSAKDKSTGQLIEHPSDWSKTFTVSPGQYGAMLDKVAFVANHPGEYGVLGNQCTGFVYDVLGAGGIAPPNNWIDNAAHPTSLRWAFDGYGENQVKPYRSDASGAGASIELINKGIADNPARLQQYIDDHIIPSDQGLPAGGYWFGAELNDAPWNDAPSTAAQASALAAEAVPVQVAGPVPEDLLALQSQVASVIGEHLPALGDHLNAYKDANGHLLVVGDGGSIEIKPDGSIRVLTGDSEAIQVTAYSAGAVLDSVTVRNPSEGQTTTTDYTYNPNSADYQTRSTVTDADGSVVRSVVSDISFNDLGEQTLEEYAIDAAGTVRTVYNNAGAAVSNSEVKSGANNLGYAAAAATSFLSLVQAIQAGKPLPMVVAGVNTLAALQAGTGSVNTTLAGAQSVLGAATSLYSLSVAWKQGDATGVLAAGASSLYYGGQAYAYMAGYTNLGAAAAGGAIGSELAGALNTAGQAMPYLNLVNSLVHGDATGVALAAVSIAFPVAAPFIGLATAIFGMFKKDPPPPWGTAQFAFNADGTVRIEAMGGNGGYEAVYNTLSAYQGALGSMVAQYNASAPQAQIGLIANRMGSLSFNGYQWSLTTIDPDSDATRLLHYDRNGQVVDAPVGSDEYFRSMGEQYVYSALQSGSLAPGWEVQTARMQSALGDPQAGLTEVQRAQRNGLYVGTQHLTSVGANPGSAGSMGRWRVIGLDLGGDGIQTVDRAASQVVFDVDGTGFGKQTAWVGAGDGMLVLDRNFNGMIDKGSELFGNTQVAIGAQGLKALGVVDANVDGNIDQRDAVYSQLRVWQDANGNGLVDNGETRSLSDMGISAIHYQRGSYDRNGQSLQISSVDLAVDSVGLRMEPVQGGIQIVDTEGHASVLVTKADDLSNVAPGKDGVQAIEDVQLDILTGTLLANDQVLGSNKSLTITAVGGARHGRVWLDDAGVHFLGDLNYDGKEAGFSYTVQDANGNTAQAQVGVGMTAVNDAPRVQAGYTSKPIYGYSHDWDTNTSSPIYTPVWGFNPKTLRYEYITEPIAYEVDPNSGRLLISDPDDSVFTITQSHAPQHGSVAINADGSWVFTPAGALGGKDAFEVTVVDGHGGRTTQVIEVELPEPWQGGGEGGEGVGDGGTGDGDGGAGGDGGSEGEGEGEGGGEGEGEGEGGGGDPLVLDLDGNGITLEASQASQAFYDIKGDGWRYRTGWITGGDGLLAFDANGDGQITGQGELSFTPYKAGARTDLEGLQAFDSNGDGQISTLDTLFEKLRVWRDANGNGLSEAGEVQTLSQAGVQKISLQSDHHFNVQADNVIHGHTQVTMQDGRTLVMADVTLAVTQQALLMHGDGSSEVVTRATVAVGTDVLGSQAQDLLLGTVGSDHIMSMDGNDFISDDRGNDVIESGAGQDVVYSGADNDIVLLDAGDDTAFAGRGDDLVLGGDGHDAVFLEAGNDVSSGGDGNDLLDGGAGADVLSGDAGEDQLAGGSGQDALFGGDGEDVLLGGDGDDLLQGDAGNDLLDGGSGADQMAGGAGDDTYVVLDAGDAVTELADGGRDLVTTSLDGYHLGSQLEDLTLNAAGDAGSPGSDTLGSRPRAGYGNELDNHLRGNALDNALDGGAGNDLLDGWIGQDTLTGGTGDDTYVVDNSGDRVIELAGEGWDGVNASVSFTLSDHVESLKLTGKAAISGGGNELDNLMRANDAGNALWGGAGHDTLWGGAGDDTLDGGEDADTLAGGAGNDIYVVDSAGDTVTEQAGQGIDLVRASVNHALGAHLENLTLTGTHALSGYGNDLNNVIRANDAGNTLLGGSGQDTLWGGAGSDLLDGGLEADLMAGGAGNDTYRVDSASDGVTELADQGTDRVESVISYTLGQHLEELILLGTAALTGTGNQGDNLLVANDAGNTLAGGAGDDNLMGGAGNDLLDGGAGADAMVGGAGDDTYIVDRAGDAVTELMDHGTDLVKASVSHSLSSHVEHLTLTGTAALTGNGNALDNRIQANDAGNRLFGAAGNDLLIGGAGNDTLDGGTGVDALFGGAGDDTYVVDSAGDSVVELAGQGQDWVRSSVSYVLAAHVENLVLTGVRSLQGTGNAMDNTLIANDAGNDLSGGAGNDSLMGGASADTLDGGQGTDVLNGGAGEDVLKFSWDVVAGEGALAQNSFTGGKVSITGRWRSQDLFQGGAGNDTLLGTAMAEVVMLDDGTSSAARLNGIEFISSGAGHDLINLTSNRFTYGNIRVDAGEGNDVIWTSAGNDWLDGGTGADAMAGGAGDDTYTVDSALDGVTELTGQGKDLVITSVSYTLAANIENMTLTGAGTISGTGNELNNVIEGNDAGNTLTGAGGDDSLIGGAGADALLGGTGNDWLDGGGGADQLSGGVGDDTYLVDSPGDTVIELAGAGTDLIMASLSYTLGASIENLTLTGAASLSGVGNDLDNVLKANNAGNTLSGCAGHDILIGGAGTDRLLGGSGDDRLDGRGGVDQLIGGTGNDTYVVDNAADVVIEGAGEGIDLVQSSVNHTLGAHVEYLTLTGTDALSGTGNGLNNVIRANAAGNALSGGAGQDILLGGGGRDWLDGGSGSDVLSGSAGSDTYVMARGHGRDRIQDYATDGATDVLSLGPDIASNQLWFSRSCNDLQVTVMGTSDQAVIENWYLGTTYQVEQFKAGDGKVLLNTQVNNLVAAMAAFDPPAPGQIQLTPHQQITLSTTLVHNWK